MGLFKNVFKRKEGGTFLGNMVRGVARQYSGGLLGNGMMMLKPGQSAKSNNELTSAKVVSALKQGANATVDSLGNMLVNEQPAGEQVVTKAKFVMQKYGVYIAGGVAALVGLFFLTKRKSGGATIR